MDTTQPHGDAPTLVDLTGIPLEDLWSVVPDDTALGRALAQVLAKAGREPGEAVSAFNSCI